MGIDQLNFVPNIDTKTVKLQVANKVEIAIMRLKHFEPPEGYYFADSYGKDSSAVDRLLDMAEVKHDAHYSQGGIDPPPLVYFGREYHPDTMIDRPKMSMWKGISIHGMPRRQARWCCELIKEKRGGGRRVVTGIRWQESPRRNKRMMFEVCQSDETKYFLHPLIDWTEDDIWEFIHQENIPYCSLYDELYWDTRKRKMIRRFKRLGCVLCPMITAQQTRFELERFPKLADAWKRACNRYWEKRILIPPKKGVLGVHRWKTPEAFWQWWLSRKGEPKVNDAQCIMFDN